MTASEHLGPQWQGGQLYHGSSAELAPGDMVEPGHPANLGAGRPDRSDHVYAATTADIASAYGRHTYEVEPTGPTHLDPELISSFGGIPRNPARLTHWRSSSPMRVTGKLE